jgi:hypothetical protein
VGEGRGVSSATMTAKIRLQSSLRPAAAPEPVGACCHRDPSGRLDGWSPLSSGSFLCELDLAASPVWPCVLPSRVWTNRRGRQLDLNTRAERSFGFRECSPHAGYLRPRATVMASAVVSPSRPKL